LARYYGANAKSLVREPRTRLHRGDVQGCRTSQISEKQALDFIRARIAKGTVVNADESANWNELHSRPQMKRINHEETYSLDGACTN
jgi:hypothetical protein